MAQPIVVEAILTSVDMHSFHIHGAIDGGRFILRPMDRQLMDDALSCMGKRCSLTIKHAIIRKIEALP